MNSETMIKYNTLYFVVVKFDNSQVHGLTNNKVIFIKKLNINPTINNVFSIEI